METSDRSFPVVGIGASAGGLEAVSELLAELPATTGMAFLLVQHLDPRHQSFLTEILAKKTKIAVETAVEGSVLKPDHLYVIPPNVTMTVADGILQLRSRESSERPPRPINILFRSLAEQHVHRTVAAVLSGTDSDGAQGLGRRLRPRAASRWRKIRRLQSSMGCRKTPSPPAAWILSCRRKSWPGRCFASGTIPI
ncbi:MAG: chemotaxis protein CheB [Candidatus Binataceae bacterium]